MKGVSRSPVRVPFRLTRADIALTLVPALLWWAAASYGRQAWISPRCAATPELCSRDSVPVLDRLAIGLESPEADFYSEVSQDVSGIAAFAVPALWSVSLATLGRLTPAGALMAIGTDFVLLAQTAAFNGVFTELSHLVSQRPRPFVYTDPPRRGPNPAHYTSFYSGHTSFAAAACTLLVLLLLARGAPLPLVGASAALGQVLIILTAVLRIFAGRHFLSDVLVAAIAGSLVALAVTHLHRKRGQTPVT